MKDTYNIVMLGPTKAGKTVFLSSMFYKLSRASSDADFTISLPAGQRQQLVQRFNVLRSKGEWPKPNEARRILEWQFDCSVKTMSNGTIKSFTPLQFNYIDYAGGLITDTEEDFLEQQQLLSKKILAADALLCLIDGAAILQVFQPESDKKSMYELENMVDFLTTEIEGSNAPAHFVISKWDLLMNANAKQWFLDDKELFLKVRNELENIPSFQSLVSSRRSLGVPIRVIPVSSVGDQFASITTSGEMSINRGAKPVPYFVEMPLACVIFDYWTLKAEQLRRKLAAERAGLETKITVQSNTSWWQNLKAMVGSQLSQLSNGLVQDSRFQQSILESLASYLQSDKVKSDEEAERREARLNNERQAKLARVSDNKTALDAVITSMRSSVIRLEQEYEGSRIV